MMGYLALFWATLFTRCLLVSSQAPGACPPAVDVCLILDGSGSVAQHGWRMTQDFASRFVNRLSIAPDLARVGVVTFGSRARLAIRLGEYSNINDLQQAIYRIPISGGQTNTPEALTLAATQCFRSSGDRPNFNNVAIFVSDGNPSVNPQTLQTAIDLLHSVTSVVGSIGVGSSYDRAIIGRIAKRADNTQPQPNVDYFHADVYNALFHFVQRILSMTCFRPLPPPSPVPGRCSQPINLCLILDSSNSLTPSGWRITQQFAVQLVNFLSISSTSTSVGVVTFSSHASLAIPLGQYRNNRDLIDAINRLPHLNGWTNTAAGLNTAASQCFRAFGNRPSGIRNVAVFVSDGMPTVQANAVPTAIRNLHSTAQAVVSVGVGIQINQNLLLSITKRSDGQPLTPNRDFFITSSIDQLPNLASQVIGTICGGPSPLNCDTFLDVCLVLDRSGSETREGWRQVQSEALQIIQFITSYTQNSHIGVISFSDNAENRFPLGPYQESHLRNLVLGIPWADGFTNLASALSLASTHCFRTTGDRGHVRNIAFIITDGNATIRQEFVPNAIHQLHTVAERVFAIGVGPRLVPTSLQNIARRQGDVFLFPQNQHLQTIIASLLNRPGCEVVSPVTPPPIPVPITCLSLIDICLVLDRSSTPFQNDWRDVQTIAVDLVELFRRFASYPYIGLTIVGETADLRLALGPYTADAIRNEILRQTFASSSADLVSGLSVAANHCFRTAGDRRDARNVVIIITRGVVTSNQHLLPSTVQQLHTIAERVIAIGAGPTAVQSTIQSIALRPEDAYLRPNRDRLNTIVSIVEALNCRQPTPQPTPFPTPAPPVHPCNTLVDICLVLDRSGSETIAGWREVQRVAVELIRLFQTLTNFPYFGLVTFSDFAEERLQLGPYSETHIWSTIMNIPFADGYTELAGALRLAATRCFRTSGDRSNAWNLALIISDGNATRNEHDVPHAINVLHSAADRVITVGVGPRVVRHELQNIARRPGDAYIYPQDHQLRELVEKVRTFRCPVLPVTPFPTPLPITCNALVDICLVLDRSGSETPRGWTQVQNYAVDLLELFRQFPLYPYFGVVTFSDHATQHLHLGPNPYTTVRDVIRNIPFANGYTNLAAALRLAASACFGGGGDRRNARNLAIVITDGNATSFPELVPSAIQELHRVTDRVIAIGSGPTIFHSSVQNIALRHEDVLFQPSRSDLSNLVTRINRLFCPPPPTPTPFPTPVPPCNDLVDICLVLDRSGSETFIGWREVQRVAIELIRQFRIFVTFPHIGIITFSDFANEQLALASYSGSVHTSVINGVPFADGYTNLAAALRLAATRCFRSRGDRPNARNIAIIISDANATIHEAEVPHAINQLHTVADRVIALGVGPRVVQHQLRNIARRPHDVYFGPQDHQLEAIVRGFGCVPVIVLPATPPPTPQPITCHRAYDVCLVLDRSGSETPHGWRDIQTLAVDLVDIFRRRLTDFPYIGIVSYSDFADIHLHLGPNSVTTIRNTILSIPFADGYTDVAAGLRLTAERCFSGGGGDRRNAQNIAIVISDANATINQHNLPHAIQLLHSLTHRVIAIGAGPNIAHGSLRSIARSPQDVYLSNARGHLDSIATVLNRCDQPVPNGGCSRSLDICFILDSSRHVGFNGWNNILDFAHRFISHLNSRVAQPHVGVVSYSTFASLDIRLGPQFEFMQRIRTLRFLNGQSNIAHGLTLAANDCFRHPADRQGYRNVAILIAGGNPEVNSANLGNAYQALQAKASSIITVGFGQRINQDLLRTLAKRADGASPVPQRDYLYTQHSSLLSQLLGTLFNGVCQ